MKVSREKAAQTRERIVEEASALFRAKGFGNVAVADIMKAAELTHGGFYGHFDSKDDLSVEASRRSLANSAERWRTIVAEAGDKPYPALIEHYLTSRHRDEPAGGCALSALGTDAARSSPALRGVFAEGLRAFLDILTGALPGFSKPAKRRKAVAAMATMVGAVTLARAVDDPALSEEILDAARQELRSATYR
jgi:TetR/AcrR family transcriptional regulator, transcriptional repressor for nem operon